MTLVDKIYAVIMFLLCFIAIYLWYRAVRLDYKGY